MLPALGRAGVAHAILYSTESLDRIVSGYYLRFLGRADDGSEEMGFVSLLQNGAALEQVQALFIASPEYQGHINTDYAQSLYINLLGRTAGLAELSGVNAALPQLGLERQLQRLVQFAPERCEHRQAGLARRVAEGLDQDGPVVGRDARDPDLAGDVVPQRLCGVGVEPAFGLEPVEEAGVLIPFGQFAGDGARVGGFEGFAFGLGRGSGVDLGGGKRLVPQHIGNRFERTASSDHLRCQTMAQHMSA